MNECKSTSRLLGAHVDGQLDTARTLEVEDHLEACETCRERILLDRAIRGSLKKSVKQSAPEGMRARMLASILEQESRIEAEAEDTRNEELSELAAAKDLPAPKAEPEKEPKRRERVPMLRHWRTALPIASAAAIALAWGVAGSQPLARGSATSNGERAHAGFGNDDLLNQFVGVHSRPLRPETQDPKEVRAFERDVGVPVRFPLRPSAWGERVIARSDGRDGPSTEVRFVGGRLLPVQGGERAAMLQYEVREGGEGAEVKRVSVFIYDPRRVQVGTPNLAARPIGTSQVQVGQAGGYSVAVAEHRGVGYAVASELDTDATARIAGAEPASE